MQAKDEEELLELHPAVFSYVKGLLARTSWLLRGEKLYAPRDRTRTNSLVETLFDLTAYEDQKLTTTSFILLDRLFNRTDALFDLAKHARILLVPESLALSRKLDLYLPVLRRIASGIVEDMEIPFENGNEQSFPDILPIQAAGTNAE